MVLAPLIFLISAVKVLVLVADVSVCFIIFRSSSSVSAGDCYLSLTKKNISIFFRLL
jgi:hypothetical protein